jgi:hypothetical protein
VESESLDGDGALRDRKLHERARPTTTVVVAWSGSMSELEHTLGGLIARCRAAEAELIVVGPSSLAERRRLGRLWPQARVIDAPARFSCGQLREIGAGAASGDIVLLVDDERLFASHVERQLLIGPLAEQEEEPDAATGDLERWIESAALYSNRQPDDEAVSARRRTLIASWRNVAALLAELTRSRVIRTSRAARS